MRGNFVDTKGNILGRHRGIVNYTVGQRKGVNVPSKDRLYVKKIRSGTNEVVLGRDHELWSKCVIARDFNYVSIKDFYGEMAVTAKIRYNQKGGKAIIRKIDDRHVECIFEEPQRAPTPGQALVCYDGNYVIGGGTIV